jgi:hypothetical protein
MCGKDNLYQHFNIFLAYLETVIEEKRSRMFTGLEEPK